MPLHCGLYNQLPDDEEGSGLEVSGTGYSRVQLSEMHIDNGVAVNADQINFPTAAGDWGTIEGFGIFDDAGTLLFSGNLCWSFHLGLGDTAMFSPASIVITDENGSAALEEKLLKILFPDQTPPEVRPEYKTIWERLMEEEAE